MTPATLLLTIIVISLFCNGLYLISQDGMIFGKLNKRLNFWIGEWWIYKPIIGCTTCMSSIWGTVVFFIVHDWSMLPYWPIACIGAAFTNTLFITYLNHIEQ